MDSDSLSLIERFRQGDQEAARVLFERYVTRLIAVVHGRISRKLARRIDPEDVVQSAFQSFFRGVDQRQFAFDDCEDLWHLLVVVALNKLRGKIEYHGAAKRHWNREQGERFGEGKMEARLFEAIAREPLPDAAAAVQDELEQLVVQVDPLAAEIIQMRLQGYQLEEIAEVVQRSERTVRRVLGRVREHWQARAAAV